MILTLEPNTKGRDFVVGDLHGCFEQFEMFRAFVGFNRLKDRMFSVGDLVDRGPDNLACLSLLKEHWFFAVKGNHEELMQDFLNGGIVGGWWMPNGGKWFYRLDQHDKNLVSSLVRDKVEPLPLLITVKGQFHVIHAELSSDEPMTDEDLADLDTFKAAALEQCIDGASVLWGRNLFGCIGFQDARGLSNSELKEVNDSMAIKMFGPGLSPIFCGHTPVQMPTKIGGQINLDTCAFNTGKRPWAGLTFAEPASGKFWKVTDDVNPVELVTV